MAKIQVRSQDCIVIVSPLYFISNKMFLYRFFAAIWKMNCVLITPRILCWKSTPSRPLNHVSFFHSTFRFLLNCYQDTNFNFLFPSLSSGISPKLKIVDLVSFIPRTMTSRTAERTVPTDGWKCPSDPAQRQ